MHTKNPLDFYFFKNPVKSSTVYFTPFHPLLTPFYLTPTKNPLGFYKKNIQFIIQYWILEPRLKILYFVKWTLQHFTTVHVAYCKFCAHERSLEGLQLGR